LSSNNYSIPYVKGLRAVAASTWRTKKRIRIKRRKRLT
jgi:hypothetical protein